MWNSLHAKPVVCFWIFVPRLMSHNFKKLIGRDGMHPTEEGYDLIDEVIAKNLVTAV